MGLSGTGAGGRLFPQHAEAAPWRRPIAGAVASLILKSSEAGTDPALADFFQMHFTGIC
jgi:hypothetical protein